MAASQVLEQIGEWAICEDAQGLFYYNTSTQQSFDTPPPEVAQLLQQAKAQAMAQAQPQTVQSVPLSEPQYVVQSEAQPPQSQAKVVQTIGEWAICQDEQGVFYQNLRTNQSFDQAPVELLMQLQQSQPAQAAPAQTAPAQAAPAQAAPAQGNKAQILKQMGDWAICRDAQGQFYHNLRTNQSYDEAPPELVRMIQGQQSPQVQPQAQPQVKQYQAQPQPQVQKYPTQQMAQYQAQQQYQAQSYQPPMVQQQAPSYSYQPPAQQQAQMYQQQQVGMQGQLYSYQQMQQMQQAPRPVVAGSQFRGF